MKTVLHDLGPGVRMLSLLFRVLWDPAIFGGGPLLLAAIAMAASFLLARRAAALDPTVAVRRG